MTSNPYLSLVLVSLLGNAVYCNAISIELKKYPQLDNVTKCIPKEQKGISCIFTGGASTSLKALEVQCLRPGALILKGNLEALKIICSAEFPIDFEYDGVQPTEALLPLFTKTIQTNLTSVPAKSNWATHFPQQTFNVELIVFGVRSQYQYFHDHSNPFFSIKPYFAKAESEETASVVHNYSRSGRYMFREIFNKSVLYEFYLFVEENDSVASFIKGKATQNAVITGSEIVFPCRPSHHDANITLTKLNDDKYLLYTVDPTRGVILPSTELKNGEYQCVLRQGSYEDKMHFNYPLSKIETDIPYGFEGLPKMLHFKDYGDLQVTYIFYVIKSVPTVRPTCDATSLEGSPPGLVYLTNIPCRNPMHCRLLREFVSPNYINMSYSVEVGKQTEELFSGLRLDSGLPFTYGVTMCQSTQHFKAMEYGVSLDGRATAVQYGFDWLKLPGRTKAEIKIYLNIGIENQTSTKLYAKQNETFRCKFFSSVLIKPVIWLVELHNGSLLFAKLDTDFPGDTSYLRLTLESNMRAIHCGASLYYKNFWRQINMNVSVFEGMPARIEVDQLQEKVRVKHGTRSHLLRCSAEGEPLPDLSWEQNGKIIKTNQKAKFIILEIPAEVNSYTCVAKNHLNTARYTFYVDVDDDALNYWIMIGIPLIVFIITVAAFIVYIKFVRVENNGLTKEEVDAFLQGVGGVSETPRNNEYVHEFSQAISYDTEFEVPSARFEIDHRGVLGRGAFGTVLKGSVFGRPVAVKTVNRFAGKSYLQALLSELKIMIYIGRHDSIVELVGAYTSELRRGNVYIFVELCGNGSAEKYLRNNRQKFVSRDNKTGNYQNSMGDRLNSKETLDENILTKWALDVACAMEYLTSKRVIHGDLAARNILVTDEMTVKVTDFGLSRQLHNYSNYVKRQQEPLPWRWMSVESLRDLSFSPQSDVWAYGVLLWELFSLAEVPYPGYTWNLDFVNLLQDGLRMSCPKYGSDNLYKSVILECWRTVPEERPSFQTISARILEYMTMPDYVEPTRMDIHFQNV